MIDVIINSYNEPNSTLRAVNTFLSQYDKDDLRVTVVDPFESVEKFLKEKIKDKRFNFYLDSGEGKAYSLNLIFQEMGSDNSDDIFISTDGDVHVSDNTIEEIKKAFENKEVGCVTARPIPVDSRDTKYGYWAHFLFDGIDKVRRRKSDKKEFMECSGYMLAIRKGVIFDFPTETAEDSIIPYLFWKKGYKIKYLPNAEVYVKNPDNYADWLNQKSRTIKAHEILDKIAPEMPRTKSLFNEIKEGTHLLTHPKKPREFIWAAQLAVARLHTYKKAFEDIRKKKSYADGWRVNPTDSTRTLD